MQKQKISRSLFRENLVLWLFVAVVLALLAYRTPARATTRTVTTLADSGAGSLRQAVADASGGDTIQCATALAGGTISLTSGALLIGQSLTIDGRAAAGLTLSGHNDSRVLQITAGSVTVTGLIIADGQTHW